MRKSMLQKSIAGLAVLSVCLGSVSMLSFAAEAEAPGPGIVETAYGQAQGVPGELEGVTLFKGVPYAAPPVGELRWAAPEDPEAWEGVRVFDTYAPMAVQWPNDMAADPWYTDFYYQGVPEYSEDCLYLNIATPSVTGDENMPVYVWFHGGGLNHGFSYEIECDPEALAQKGVVVVEVAQRLGVFGYMALPQLDEETGYGASGNWGLMDEMKAIEWIVDNIAGFGGDPTNITVGGQSGGTSKSGALFANDEMAKLLSGAIWQTSLQYTSRYNTVEAMEERSIKWLQSLGLTGEESLEELRALDADFLLGEESTYGQAPQGMVFDGHAIQYATLKEAYEAGNFEGVHILAGTDLGEFTQERFTSLNTTEAFYDYYRDMLGDELYEKYDFPHTCRVVDSTAVDTARIMNHSVFTVTNNMLFGIKAEEYKTGDVYIYLFTRFTPGRNEDYYWAWHSSELWYTFGSLRAARGQRGWEEWDYELADIVTSYWTNFMKTGDPNGEGLPEWLPSNSEHLAYMDLGEENTIGCVTYMDSLKQMAIEYYSPNYGL